MPRTEDIWVTLDSRHPAHQVYPYLLRDLKISRPQSCPGPPILPISPLARGFVYLFAVLDWASRRVLAWRLSNTLTTDFCLEAVRDALAHDGTPDIFNTDQGCQFYEPRVHRGCSCTTAFRSAWTEKAVGGITCSWNDSGRALNTRRSICTRTTPVSAAHQGLERYLTFYNQTRAASGA
jgi:putative transposase